MDKLYTVQEAAAYFKVARQTVYDWMSNGDLGYVLVGGRRRITESAIKAFVKTPVPGEQTEGEVEEDIATPLSQAA